MKAKNPSAFWREFVENGKLNDIGIIDTHTHMDDVYDATMPVHDIDGCVRIMDREGIDSIWCAPHPDLFSVETLNGKIESYMAKYPARVKGYFSFNPNYPEKYADRLHRVLEIENYIGFKFLPVYHNVSLSDERYAPALELAEEHNLIVLSHTWGKTECSPKEVEGILKRYKNLQFIMGHSSPNELDGAIALARKYDNAYLDLCDIHRHSGIVEKMVERAGSKKVLFGTDFPWYDPNYCIGSVICANISDDEKEDIFYKNARGMLGQIKKGK